MQYFKHLINKFCFKVKSSNLFKFFFGCVFLFFFIPNVHAFSVANRELGYLTGTIGYNYASDTTWQNLPLSFGTEYSVYYTTNAVTTGTYGIAFGGLTGTMLVPGHYYSLIYASSKPSSGCKVPHSWNQVVASRGIVSGSTQNLMQQSLHNMSQSIVFWSDDAFDSCIYSIVFEVSNTANYMMFPVNSNSTEQNIWVFYGYNIEDLGLTSNLTSDDLTSMQSALQTSITNMQNSINSNLDAESTNIQNKIDSAKNQAHSDHQALMNQDHSYNNNASDTVPNSSDINSVINQENTLRSDLDLDVSTLDIQLNTDATTWIWGIVNNIRTINGKITLLFTTILSLAIIKMVLNR